MGVSQFGNPSCIVPVDTGFYLFSSDSGNPHVITLQFAPTVEGNTALNFSDATFSNYVNGSITPANTCVVTNGALGQVPIYGMALDEQTIELVYAGTENGQTAIFHQSFIRNPQDPSSLVRVNSAECLTSNFAITAPQNLPPIVKNSPPMTFAVTQIVGEPVYLVSCASTTMMLLITSVRLVDSQNSQQLGPLQFNCQEVNSLNLTYNTWTGDISMAAFPQPSTGPGVSSYGVAAAVRRDTGWQIWSGECGLQPATNSNPYFMMTECCSATQNYSFVSVVPAPDGTALLLAGDSNNQLLCWKIVPSSLANAFSSLQPVSGGSNVSQPPAVYTTASESAPGDTTSIVTMDTFALFAQGSFLPLWNGRAMKAVYNINANGVQGTGQKGMLVGIIDSGPPVPNENVKWRNLSDNDKFGETTFGQAQTNATDWSFSASFGAIVKVKGSDGIPEVCGTTLNVSLSLGINGGMSRGTESEYVITTYATSNGIEVNGGNVVDPRGMALVLLPAYVGYEYTFIDSNNNPIPGVPQYLQLYLDTQNSVQQTLPFDYDTQAATGPIPGNLLSYSVTPDLLSQWDQQSALNVSVNSQNTTHLTTTWGGVGGQNSKTANIQSGSENVGAYLDFQTAVGVTFGPDDDQWGGSAGIQLKADYNYAWSFSNNNTFECELDMDDVSPDQEQAGAYSSYTFSTYMLKQNASYATNLIALLTSNPTPDNTKLLNSIDPNSQPWRICYAVSACFQPYPPSQNSEAAAVSMPKVLV